MRGGMGEAKQTQVGTEVQHKRLSRNPLWGGGVVLIATWALLQSQALASGEANSSQSKLTEAVKLLESTPTGKTAVAQARSLHIPVREGAVSKTEVTATRVSQGKKEELKFNVQVLVSVDKETAFQALDLAHELTHAIHPKENPFNPDLSASQYVRHGIEGDGGEAQAIAQECQVGKELIQQNSVQEKTAELIKARCQFVWKTENDPSRWKRSFYQLGNYYHQFRALLKGDSEDLKLETKSPMFASAVAHKPYPLALLEEYVQITKTICERARKLQSSNAIARSLASTAKLDQRCRAVED